MLHVLCCAVLCRALLCCVVVFVVAMLVTVRVCYNLNHCWFQISFDGGVLDLRGKQGDRPRLTGCYGIEGQGR